MSKSSVHSIKIKKVINYNDILEKDDLVAVEEPLEIRLAFGDDNEIEEKRISVTMRTPGNDFELAVGFLYSEGIISDFNQIENVKYCVQVKTEEKENVVKVNLKKGVIPDLNLADRNFYTNSSCGVCGKTAIEAIQVKNCPVIPIEKSVFNSRILNSLPDSLSKEQSVFHHTGGLHASGLFNFSGKLELLREDIGRHNALDKLIGASLFNNKLPLNNSVLLLSGRISFELVQKAITSGIPIIVAIGAPSSLAVSLAKDFGLTLIGFVKEKKFNIYSGHERISFN